MNQILFTESVFRCRVVSCWSELIWKSKQAYLIIIHIALSQLHAVTAEWRKDLTGDEASWIIFSQPAWCRKTCV